jgi:hypothetical protein
MQHVNSTIITNPFSPDQMMSHYQYSYERVKDDSSVLNASVVQKVTNNTSSSPKEKYLKDDISMNNFERGESERQN